MVQVGPLFSRGGQNFQKKNGLPGPIFQKFWSPGPIFPPNPNFRDKGGGGGITLLSFTLPTKALHYSSRKKKTCSYTAQATAAVEDRRHSIFPPPDIFSSGANGLRIWPPPRTCGTIGRKLRPWGESSGLMRRGI